MLRCSLFYLSTDCKFGNHFKLCSYCSKHTNVHDKVHATNIAYDSDREHDLPVGHHEDPGTE